MSSQFYKRYVPPPKALKIERKPAKRSTPQSLGDERPPKRPTPEPESSHEETRPPEYEPDASEASTQGPLPVKKHGLTPLPQPAPYIEGPKVSLSAALPDWIRNPVTASTSTSEPFESILLSPDIASNLKKQGFVRANGLQCTVIPLLIPGRFSPGQDICVSAATGSGKTLAYVLPLVEHLRDKPVTRLRGLVIVPTRELVAQVRDTFTSCASGTGLRVGTAVGSDSLKEEQNVLVQAVQKFEGHRYMTDTVISEDEEAMNWDTDAMPGPRTEIEQNNDSGTSYASKLDILICTPGRLVDHINCTKGFTLEHVQWLVIDEADRLLDESFQQWVSVVIPQLEHLPPLDYLQEQLLKSFYRPRRRDVRKIILSATMTRDISKLAAIKLQRPKLIVLEGNRNIEKSSNGKAISSQEERFELPSTLFEFTLSVKKTEDKPLYLLRLLKEFAYPPASFNRFVGTQTDVDMTDANDNSNDDPGSTSTSSSSSSSHYSTPSKPRHSLRDLRGSFNIIRGTLVFTNSKEHALRLAHLLKILLPDQSIGTLTKSVVKSGGRKTLNAFRNGSLSVLIATDLASRGIDVLNLAHVINYDLPTSLNSYVHRVGRTARAWKDGRATTLVEHAQGKWFSEAIVHASSIARTNDVVKMRGGPNASKEDRDKYEGALQSLGEEAMGMERVNREGK